MNKKSTQFRLNNIVMNSSGHDGQMPMLNAQLQQQLAAFFAPHAAALNGTQQASLTSGQPVVPQVRTTTVLPSSTHLGNTMTTSSSVSQPSSSTSVQSLPWPLVNPVVHVQHFDINAYKNVNMDVSPSQEPTGYDLPLTDVTTLRFFFNLGVAQARHLSNAQEYQQKIAALNAVTQLSSMGGQLQGMAGLLGQNAGMDQISQLGLLNTHALLRAQVMATAQAQHNQQAAQQQQQQQQQAQLQAAAQQAQQQQAAQQQAAQQQAHAAQLQQQQQQLIQAQLLAAAARASNANGSNTVERPPLDRQAELLALAQGTGSLGGTPAAAAAAQLVRQQQTSLSQQQQQQHHQAAQQLTQQNANAAASAAQTALLQHALMNSAVANLTAANKNNSNLHEMRLQLLQQNMLFVNKQQEQMMPKPVPLGGSSNGGDAVSPRPPPLDPSPPRHHQYDINRHRSQQAQTSPTQRKDSLSAGSAPGRPRSAREGVPSTSSYVPPPSQSHSVTSSGSDEHPPQTLFQMSEQHFDDAFHNRQKPKSSSPSCNGNPIGIARHNGGGTSSPQKEGTSKDDEKKNEKDDEDKPALAPILMMSYLNNCMTNLKSTLNTNGVPVGMDFNGRPVDYSARPVDPIFQQARAQLDSARDFRESLSPQRKPSATGNPLGIANPHASSSRKSPVVISNPLGINRTLPDATTSDIKTEDDSDDDDGPGQKRLRIATDED